MLDLMSTQYDAFIFWRTPIPVIDLAEMEILLPCSGGEGAPARTGACLGHEDDAGLAEYNSFNFWRSPIATFNGIDLELL